MWWWGGLVVKVHRLQYHSTLGSRVKKEEEKVVAKGEGTEPSEDDSLSSEDTESFGFMILRMPGEQLRDRAPGFRAQGSEIR